MKLLIFGLGGYTDAIVLPVLRKHFPNIDAYILGHNPLKSLNFSNKNNLNIYQGENFDEFDMFMLTTPCWDYPTIIKKLQRTG